MTPDQAELMQFLHQFELFPFWNEFDQTGLSSGDRRDARSGRSPRIATLAACHLAIGRAYQSFPLLKQNAQGGIV